MGTLPTVSSDDYFELINSCTQLSIRLSSCRCAHEKSKVELGIIMFLLPWNGRI